MRSLDETLATGIDDDAVKGNDDDAVKGIGGRIVVKGIDDAAAAKESVGRYVVTVSVAATRKNPIVFDVLATSTSCPCCCSRVIVAHRANACPRHRRQA